jgi:uracil-DNA glycosylase family 4
MSNGYPEECNGCPFREESTGFVPGVGPADAKVLVCGEAPGKRELATGEPFVGPAGQELNQLLSIAGIDRTKVYVTNACKCLPAHKTPSHSQTNECRSRYLNKEIDSHSFKYVLALGRIATSVFGVPEARKQGPAHGYILDRGSHYILSTWHPAYIIRTQFISDGEDGVETKGVTARVEAQHDMLKFKRFVNGDLPLEAAPATLSPFSQLLTDEPNTVALDIETKGLDKFHNEIVLCGAAWRDSSGQIHMASESFDPTQVGYVLSDSRIKKVFHNINFDVGVLYHTAGKLTNTPFTCTQLLGSLLGSDLPKGLEFLARAYLNTSPWKWTADTDHKRYNALDCWATLRLHEEFTKPNGLLEEVRMQELCDRSEKALKLTVDAHLQGVRVDTIRMGAIHTVMEKKVKEAEHRLNALLQEHTDMKTLNWNSPQQVQHLLYEILDLPKQFTTDVKTKKRRLTSDANALESLSKLHPIPATMRAFKLFGKYTSTYLNPRLVVKGRLFPEFRMDVTATGRFASRGPNFQNQPRTGPVKSIYLPDRPDHYFVEVDFSQIEMRVMVHLSGETALEEVYEKGYDLHTEVAKTVFEKPTVTPEERHMAKYIVYGLGYGRGAKSLAEQYGWSIPEAQAFIRTFSKRYPRLWEWRREQVRTAENERYLANAFNRRRYFYGRNFTTRAYNFKPQSTALDILIDGMLAIDQQTSWRQMIWVHDSYGLSVPKKEIQDALHILPEILGTCRLGFPTPIDIKYGNSWGDKHAD